MRDLLATIVNYGLTLASTRADADAGRLTAAAVSGQLGLVHKHKFLYYFDYGACNEFEVETIDIRPQAEPGAYPRVVDGKGEAPPQYDWPDDDEDT